MYTLLNMYVWMNVSMCCWNDKIRSPFLLIFSKLLFVFLIFVAAFYVSAIQLMLLRVVSTPWVIPTVILRHTLTFNRIVTFYITMEHSIIFKLLRKSWVRIRQLYFFLVQIYFENDVLYEKPNFQSFFLYFVDMQNSYDIVFATVLNLSQMLYNLNAIIFFNHD